VQRVNRPYSTNARADTGGKYQLLAWAFRTAATVINNLFSSLLLGFQVTVISEYSRLVCVGDRKLSCKRQKYIRDKGRRLQKRSGTAEGLQAHRRPYCKDSVRWAISWNALLYSRDTSHAVAALRSTSSYSLESPTPSKQPHLEPRPVGINCFLMENSTTEPISHSVQLVLTEDVRKIGWFERIMGWFERIIG